MTDSLRENVASLLPEVFEFEKQYWDALQNGVFMIQKCGDCGHNQFPPSTLCTNCLSENVQWVPCSGKAKLWSKVCFHKSYLKPYPDTPYSVALVKLEEGAIVTARLPEEYKDMELDSAVYLGFAETADGTKIPVCLSAGTV